MSDFLKIMKVSLIPAIERMIVAEERHLNFLKTHKIVRQDFIKGSEDNLAFLKMRLEQYNKFLIDNLNDEVPK